MALQVTSKDWRALFPRAPQAIIDAFAAKQHHLDRAGVTESETRLAYAVANVAHECGGFTIKNLTENINYTAERMAAVWPKRFANAGAVRAKYGSGPGWRLKAFNDIYGNRMGNRAGTDDGSRYIGRGGPQITGRDGYAEVGKRAGLDLVNNPELAILPEHQPAILAAFWEWKGLNRFADKNDFLGCVKSWNGGTNGLADRKSLLAEALPIVAKIKKGEAFPLPPDVPEAPKPETTPWYKRLRNWIGGTVVGGGLGGGGVVTGWDWHLFLVVALTVVVVGLILFGLALWLFGKDGVAGWVKRKLS
jgi:predicted chitinase